MAHEIWRALKPDDTTMRPVTSYDPLHESFTPGDYMTGLGHEVHDIGFALRYARDPSTFTPLEIQTPALVQITPLGNGYAHTVVNGERGPVVWSAPYPLADEGWVFGQWSPVTQAWNLQVSPAFDPAAGTPILFEPLRASTYDPFTVSDRLTQHGGAGPRIASMTFGPWPSLLHEAGSHADGSRQQYVYPGQMGQRFATVQAFEGARDEVFGFSLRHNGPGVRQSAIPPIPLRGRAGPYYDY
jgi:hypothetical protein